MIVDPEQRITNILDWNDYLKDGGKLTYHQWIQCLIDSGNITKKLGTHAIEIYDEGEGILSISHTLRAKKWNKKVLKKLNEVL